MISTCLIEPLVAPLVGRDSGSGRSSALRRSALATTAIAISALVAVGTRMTTSDVVAKARAAEERQVAVKANAHKMPERTTSAKDSLERLLAVLTPREELVLAPAEAAPFDHEAVLASRRRHGIDRTRSPGPGLWQGQRRDRLAGGLDTTFLLFGSGKHRSALPT